MAIVYKNIVTEPNEKIDEAQSSFASLAEFNAAVGGASAYGDGPVVIGGTQKIVKNGALQSIATTFINSIAPLGDSIAMQCNNAPAITALSAAGGIATATVANHGANTGDVRVIANAVETGFNGAKVVTVIDRDTLQYSVNFTGTVTATGSPSITYPWRISERNYLQWAKAKSRNVVLGGNYGQSGATTDEIIASLPVLVNVPEKIIVVVCGINDIIGGNKRGSSYVSARLKTIFEALLASGKIVISLGILPLGVGHAGNDSRSQQQIINVNKFCASFQADGYFYGNAYGEIVDETDADGVAKATHVFTDHLHLTQTGARAIGENVLSPILEKLFPAIDTLPKALSDTYTYSETNITTLTSSDGVANAELAGHGLFTDDVVYINVPGAPEYEGVKTVTRIDTDNFTFPVDSNAPAGPIGGNKTFSLNANGMPNPLMQGSSGTVSGTGVTGTTVPNNIQIRLLSGTATVAASSSARADGFGEDAIATISSASSGAEVSINGTASWIRAQPGEEIQLSMSVSLTGMTNVGRLLAYVSVTIDGDVFQLDALNAVPSTFDNTDWSGELSTIPFKIPESAARPTSMSFNVRVIFSASSGAAVLKVGRVKIENLTMSNALLAS